MTSRGGGDIGVLTGGNELTFLKGFMIFGDL